MTTIVLLRRDLRLYDNPALFYACKQGNILPVYIADTEAATWETGQASQWWLHHSLSALNQKLEKHKLRLCLKTGDTTTVLLQLCKELNSQLVVWNRRYEPDSISADKHTKAQLSNAGITVKSFQANVLNEPWTVMNKQGTPFKVYTPYWKHCLAQSIIETPLPEPQEICGTRNDIDSCSLESLQLLPHSPDWSSGIQASWQPGEQSAQQKWADFLHSGINNYQQDRNIPSIQGTSGISPHLAFGEISPRQIWHDLQVLITTEQNPNYTCYLSEIGWREFSYYQLYHYPHITERSFNPKFDHFRWEEKPDALQQWQRGLTGYPIVDAGMRELWHTGYMHNRVRMVVASFLCKDLLIHWHQGARWFWDTLVDADLASNTAGWQWTAGCGADAAPFFRIFNPVIQGEKFDPQAYYVKRWVPELKQLPNRFIHQPWAAPADVLSAADVVLGQTYPAPMVDHKVARLEALERLKDLKNQMQE
ncbi:MAG: cryptochrome/photolyase family protein [Arenicella sp.]